MTSLPSIRGLVPESLVVRSTRIVLDSLEVQADIGFHPFEVGTPQKLLVTVEIWLDEHRAPADDDPAKAWDYDLVRGEVQRIATERRYNLQETLVHAIFDFLAARRGVAALRLRTAKPDIYPDAAAVGIEIASFDGPWPER